MRILHFNDHGSNVGGVEGYIADVSRALASAGHATHLIHFVPDRGDLIADTTHVALEGGTSLVDSVKLTLERAITKFHPDVAYMHVVNHPGLVWWIAQRLPTVGYVHSPWVVCPGYAQYLRKTARVCPYRAGLICMLNAQIENCCFGRSPLTHARRLVQVLSLIEAYQSIPILVGSTFMRQLLHHNRIPREHIGILPPILFEDSCSEFVPTSNTRKVLFVGRLVPEKGLRQLIEAISPLDVDWELIVAGDGPKRETYQDLANKLDINHKLKLVGWVSKAQMTSLYRECAFVVLPSLWPEPFGRVGSEAFFHGRPVVAFAVGGVPDWLEHGVSGYLVPPGDVAQLRHSLEMLLMSPLQQVEMGRNARAKAMEAWSAHSHINSLLHSFAKARSAVKAC